MIDRVNDDVVLEIFKHLGILDSLNLIRTSSRFYHYVADNRKLWRDLITDYSCIGDIEQPTPPLDVDSRSTAHLKCAVLRMLFLHSNLQRGKPIVRHKAVLETHPAFPSFFDFSENSEMVGQYLIGWGSHYTRVIKVLDMCRDDHPVYEIDCAGSYSLRRRISMSDDNKELYFMFWKGMISEIDGCIVVKKLCIPKDRESLLEASPVITDVVVPIHCNFYVVGDSSVDSVRRRLAVAFVNPHRATDDESFSWGLLVVLDWVTNAGVVIDTGLISSRNAFSTATRIIFSGDGKYLIIWLMVRGKMMAKSYDISKLEEHKNVIDTESYVSPLTSTPEGETLESEYFSFPTDRALVFPRHGIGETDVRLSGPRYDDIPGDTSSFTLHSRVTVDQRFGDWTVTHFYANGIYPCSPNLYTLTISNPVKHRLRHPLIAVDSYHFCWIAMVPAQTNPTARESDRSVRRLFMVRFADAHGQGPKYQPRILEVPEDVLDEAEDIWLRMDVAAVVIHTQAEPGRHIFHWIRLA